MRNDVTIDFDSLIEKVGVGLALKYVRVFCFTPSLKQRAFAEQIGMSLDSVKSYECGRRKPSKEVMNKIREITNDTSR